MSGSGAAAGAGKGSAGAPGRPSGVSVGLAGTEPGGAGAGTGDSAVGSVGGAAGACGAGAGDPGVSRGPVPTGGPPVSAGPPVPEGVWSGSLGGAGGGPGAGGTVLTVEQGGSTPYLDFAVIGLVHALVLSMLVYTLGGASGAHFNPAVTTTLAAPRKIAPLDAFIYIVVQLSGAILGAFLCKALLNGPVRTR